MAVIDARARLEMRIGNTPSTRHRRGGLDGAAPRESENSDSSDADTFDATTALHEAVAAGLPLVVEALVEAGHRVDVVEQARHGATVPTD